MTKIYRGLPRNVYRSYCSFKLCSLSRIVISVISYDDGISLAQRVVVSELIIVINIFLLAAISFEMANVEAS